MRSKMHYKINHELPDEAGLSVGRNKELITLSGNVKNMYDPYPEY